MSKDTRSPKPPPGIRPDYEVSYSVGTYGPLDEEAIAQVLRAELTPRFQESYDSVEQSWSHIHQSQHASGFLRAYGAFREATQVYPMTAKNWHSGERVPIVHAEEVANDAVVLAFQAHYKHAYQSLRETIELIVLQVYFFKSQDKLIVSQWGRGEKRTPNARFARQIGCTLPGTVRQDWCAPGASAGECREGRLQSLL